ncbi:hypothetical protein [uncultured Winogradskyella sp.]|uniref:hypothetical protein n=1 Tax=uncultured Winogradskyella sp. TaxID=395353 RepID=UPI0026380407|nr:hypothetical protein [uncultured Winogradskyella sp.]
MKQILFVIAFIFTGFFQTVRSQNQIVKDSLSISNTISLDEKVGFGDYEVKFKKVITDSRCPKKVMCVRAGEADVLVSIYKDGMLLEDKKIRIDASGYVMESNNLEFKTNDFRIYAYSLTPYPDVIDTIKKKDYRLEIIFQPKHSN